MSDEQQGPQRPTSSDGREGWGAYWEAQGMLWRTEPEIDEERQQFLHGRRLIKADIAQMSYSFSGLRLKRDDIEWLLATHEDGRGPVDWDEVSQRKRQGLDVRGADLSDQDLTGLPLANLRGGLTGNEWDQATTKQRQMASVRLERATLTYAHLEGSALTYAHLEGARIVTAHLEAADLQGAHWGADPPADIHRAFFDAATKLENAQLANDSGVGPRMVDVHWGGTNLGTVDWRPVRVLGDVYRARQRTLANGKLKDREQRFRDFRQAVSANRQLAAALRAQGLSEDADRFAYRAQRLQREVLRRQRRYLAWAGSALLDGLAGYGFKPARALLVYLVLIVSFAATYSLIGPSAHLPLSPLEAVVFSVTSFHGRGFSPGESVTLANPLTVLAAAEAILGLLVEITFIATFTQRFFGSR